MSKKTKKEDVKILLIKKISIFSKKTYKRDEKMIKIISEFNLI